MGRQDFDRGIRVDSIKSSKGVRSSSRCDGWYRSHPVEPFSKRSLHKINKMNTASGGETKHPSLAAFPVRIELDVAWGDMDSYAHVNNVVYFRYFENARIPYLDRVGWMRSMQETGLGPIVASTSARYRKPVSYPDRLLVGARVRDVHTDRVTFEYCLVSTKWNAVAAEGQAVVVSYDYRKESKCPIPDEVRAAIEELERVK